MYICYRRLHRDTPVYLSQLDKMWVSRKNIRDVSATNSYKILDQIKEIILSFFHLVFFQEIKKEFTFSLGMILSVYLKAKSFLENVGVSEEYLRCLCYFVDKA
jgi:hypothetical protein